MDGWMDGWMGGWVDGSMDIENLLHKNRLHVSAFCNGHFQAEIEKT